MYFDRLLGDPVLKVEFQNKVLVDKSNKKICVMS